MTNVVKTNNFGVISQLRSMLTNHNDRPEFVLKVQLYDKEDNMISEDEFHIYANDPVTKVYEKVEKLRVKGGFHSLKVLKMNKTFNNTYELCLQM